MNFYLDIETTGIDPKTDKIITIQYAELERNTGKQIGDLIILKEWELVGEEQLLQKFIQDSPIVSSCDFDFVSVGYNLPFEHKFLSTKSKLYNLPEINILARPHIDLHTVGILINNGEFKGSGLDKITNKKHSGVFVPAWYAERKFSDIENYIKNEFLEFVDFNIKINSIMPSLRSQI